MTTPNGPYKQMTKSSDSCVKEFPTSSFYHQMVCYVRMANTRGLQSEQSLPPRESTYIQFLSTLTLGGKWCRNDRRPTLLTINASKISVEDKINSLECESYSIVMEGNDAFWEQRERQGGFAGGKRDRQRRVLLLLLPRGGRCVMLRRESRWADRRRC